MPNFSDVRDDMVEAEGRVRDALGASTPAARCQAIMDAYWQTREEARDAFVLVLAGNLTLRASSSTSPSA